MSCMHTHEHNHTCRACEHTHTEDSNIHRCYKELSLKMRCLLKLGSKHVSKRWGVYVPRMHT